jgi:hypothetical protein
MMLTGGIEVADGKSNFAAAGVPAVEGIDDSAGVRKPAPVVACGDGADAGVDVDGVALAVAPEPLACQASACAPIDASNNRDFIFATTRAESRSNRTSVQSAPPQPRVVRTWATRP